MCNRSNGTLDIFQSTLPLRGATGVAPKVKPGDAISIHAPLTGSDQELPALKQYAGISIHAPLTGSDNFFGITYASP